MEDRKLRCSRRKFLAQPAALTLGGLPLAEAAASGAVTQPHARPPRPPSAGRKPLAVVCTVYRPLSYAAHLTARFLHGYPRGGGLHVPRQYVASLYVDQTPDNDQSREVGREFG